MRCPKCYSEKLSRKYASFYVPVDKNGDDNKNFNDHRDQTELTEETLCSHCGHEFDWDSAE